jgi:hypothetical protein
MFNKLYVRIWLAVVMAVAVLILLVGWVWRLAAEPPLRDLVVRNEAGQIIGRGGPRAALTDDEAHARMMRRAMRRDTPVVLEPAATAASAPDDTQATDAPDAAERPPGGHGPELEVHMPDGQTMRMRLMRAPPSFWSRPPFGFAWMLVWVGIAVDSAALVDCSGSAVGGMSVGTGCAGMSVGAAGGRVIVGGADCDSPAAVGGATWGVGLLKEHADAMTTSTASKSHSRCRRNILDLPAMRVDFSECESHVLYGERRGITNV